MSVERSVEKCEKTEKQKKRNSSCIVYTIQTNSFETYVLTTLEKMRTIKMLHFRTENIYEK